MSNVIVGAGSGALAAWILVNNLVGQFKFNEVKIAPQTVSGSATLWSGSVKVAIVLVYGDGDNGVTVCVNETDCVSGDVQALEVYANTTLTITASGSGNTPTIKVVYT